MNVRLAVTKGAAAVDYAYIFQEFASQFGFVKIGIQIGVIGVVDVLVDALQREEVVVSMKNERHPANGMHYLSIFYLCVASTNRC